MNPAQKLRDLLRTEKPLVMPDAYDALTARLIEAAEFKAVQCSGFSMALAALGAAETSLTLEKNLEITRTIVQAVRVPVMADGEDGYGPPERVFATVQAFCDAGVAGINIEDQVLPPPQQKAVVDPSVMIEKIRAAREGAVKGNAPELIINARTDALVASQDRVQGLREAAERGNAYLSAGADLVFVVGVTTLDEAEFLVREIQGPVSIAAGLHYNIRNMSIRDLRERGVARVSLPSIAVFAALQGVKSVLSLVRDTDSFDEVVRQDLLCSMQDVSKVV